MRIRELFNKLESAEAETLRLDSLMENDPENEIIELAWDNAYKVEYNARMELVKHIEQLTSGKIDVKTANTMLSLKRQELKNLVERIA